MAKQWRRTLLGNRGLHASFRNSWDKIVEHTLSQSEAIWQRVKGPGAAMVATLEGEGWQAIAPLVWIDEEGKAWHMAGPQAEAGLQKLKRNMIDSAWRRAATFHQGGGLQFGADLAPTKKFIRQLAGDIRGSALAETIITAGM